MKKKRSPWPFAIAGFLAVILVVNFTMLAMAIKSDDGITDENYYEKGLFYDSRRAADRELGWDIALNFRNGPRSGSLNDVEIRILDKNGTPVEGATVRVVIKRPATDRFDSAFALVRRGPSYSGAVAIPSSGFWDLEVRAYRGEKSMERVFRVKV